MPKLHLEHKLIYVLCLELQFINLGMVFIA